MASRATTERVPTRVPRTRRLVRPELKRELWLSIAIVTLAVAVPLVSGSTYWLQAMLLANVYLIAASGLNILRSQAEQMSFGQGAVLGVSAYTMALAIGVWGFSPFNGALLGFAAGMMAGLLMSLPSLRVQGYYLALVTMAGALALPEVFFLFEDQTRATTGVNVLPSGINDIAFWRLDWLTIVILACSIGSLVLTGVVRSSRFGRQLRVAGASPEAAATLGLRPGRLRLLAFALASVCASLAGVLYVLLIQYVAPGSFTLALSILLYFVVVIGGAGTIAGPIAGVVVLYIVPEVGLVSLLDYRLLIYGMIAYIVIFLMPDGVVGGLRRVASSLRKKAEPGGGIALAALLMNAPPAGARAQAGARETGAALLKAENLTARFGRVQALDGISIEIGRGEIHAIVGPNGSGKTTLLNALSGLVTVDQGTVWFDGEDITPVNAGGRAARGLARTFQTPRVFGDMTVWENVDCGPSRKRSSTDWIEKALQGVRAQWDGIAAHTLPHGQRRSLEIARALHRAPTLLALDEPAAGLSPAERQELSSLLRAVVAATGASVVMVEHDLELVWNAADFISVVDAGKVLVTGRPADIRHMPEIRQLFAGVTDVPG
ncbi:MAG: transporter [Sphaerisporangium sp.]|nr:transporter [Sphaerisporangium sp.]